jgi:hypothetical protein
MQAIKSLHRAARFFRISDYRGQQFPTTDSPVLTVCRERQDYTISLDYRSVNSTRNQAIEFVTGFVERLGEPLRHLL